MNSEKIGNGNKEHNLCEVSVQIFFPACYRIPFYFPSLSQILLQIRWIVSSLIMSTMAAWLHHQKVLVWLMTPSPIRSISLTQVNIESSKFPIGTTTSSSCCCWPNQWSIAWLCEWDWDSCTIYYTIWSCNLFINSFSSLCCYDWVSTVRIGWWLLESLHS
jgi:hypothetical protein